MAAPQNTFTSVDQVGIREDLEDTIYNIDPDDTPLYSMVAKIKAKATQHDWMTDALRASAENKHLEGDDTIATARTPTVRLNNQCQIFKESATISGTDDGLDKAGRAGEMAYQVVLATKEMKLDIEKALFANNAKVARDSSTAGELAGLPSWIATNVSSDGGSTDATGDGSDARVDGSTRAFSQALFDGVMQNIWIAGGKPDCVYLSSTQMDKALDFVGNNNQRNAAGEGKISNTLTFYSTPWGQVKWVMSREHRARDVFILQKDKWAVANLRPVKNTPLAKTGDSEKRQIVAELTLVSRNEKASGAVYDCN